MDYLFSAYITNEKRYAEGRRAGEWLEFPTTKADVQALLKRIGVDGIRQSEYVITSFDSMWQSLTLRMGENENIDTVNFLAFLLSRLDQSDIEKFDAIAMTHSHVGADELINLAENLECFEYFPHVTTDEMLGRIYVDDMEMLEVPDELRPYFDFGAYGRAMRESEAGRFSMGGYVIPNGAEFIEVYHGPEDIPKDKRVFAYPRLSIREQMAAYKEVKQNVQRNDLPPLARNHEDR